jgi:hypothetical protein
MSWKDQLDSDCSEPRFGAMDGGMWVAMVFAFIFLGIGAIWFYAAWTPDTQGAQRILQEDGYSQIQITGADPMMCGKGDLKGTKFRAKNQAGNTVTGVVCCGAVMKGCTIRR